MNVIVGIDIGGSTTKICAFTEDKKLLCPATVRAADPVTSLYGAFGKFTSSFGLKLTDIRKVMVTGVGSSFTGEELYGLPCEPVPEFNAVGLGGLYLSGLSRALVVSMGTGTAVVYAEKGKPMEYLGGTGVGGGTVMGLSRLLLKLDDIGHISEMAEDGNLDRIDLRIRDITNTKKDVLSGMAQEMTAANFGKVSDLASKADIARGLLNMVYETVAMVALFAARTKNVSDIILTGNLSQLPYAKEIFPTLSQMFGTRFLIPENAAYATVIGTALCG